MNRLPGSTEVDPARLNSEALQSYVDGDRFIDNWIEQNTFMPRSGWIRLMSISEVCKKLVKISRMNLLGLTESLKRMTIELCIDHDSPMSAFENDISLHLRDPAEVLCRGSRCVEPFDSTS